MGKGIEGIRNDCMICKCFCGFVFSISSSFPFAGKGFFYLPEGFPYGFVFGSIGKHCSYISFIFFRVVLRLGPGDSPGLPPLFVIRFSPWFQLYGEALLIHFTFAVFAASLQRGFWRLPFSYNAVRHEIGRASCRERVCSWV